MAFEAVDSLSQTLNQVLDHDQYGINHDLDQTALQEIQSLQEKVLSFLSFLKDLHPKATMKFEERIRDVADQVAATIEEFYVSELYRKCCPNHSDNQFPSHEKLERFCRDLQKASRKIADIWIETSLIVEGTSKPNVDGFKASSSRVRHSAEDIMVGFEDELMAVRSRLCGESSKRDIIPIVGVAGSGKTTLARHVYNDKLTTEAFEFRAWVTISQEYRVQEILLELLSIKGPSTLDAEFLIEQVYKYLEGRRYLIVLDDIWNGEAWDAIMRAFPEDNNGSRVILTTRSSEVARYVDSFAPLHQMHLLNEEQSWDLLQKKIFGEESCPPELEAIGRMISKRCLSQPYDISSYYRTASFPEDEDHRTDVNTFLEQFENLGTKLFEYDSD